MTVGDNRGRERKREIGSGVDRGAVKEDVPWPCWKSAVLEKWYGRRQVVAGVDYEVTAGRFVGLLGPNGAGKTTSFRMTIGRSPPTAAKSSSTARDVTNLPMTSGARSGWVTLPRIPGLSSTSRPKTT